MKRDGVGSRMSALSLWKGAWANFSSPCKITLFLLPGLAIFVFFRMESVLFTWLFALGLLLSTHPNREWWVTRFVPLAGSLAFFAVWLPWTVPGELVWVGHWVSPSWAGMEKGLFLWLKGTTMAMGFLGLGRVASSNEILATFQGFKIPPVLLCVVWITIQQTRRLLTDWRRALQAHRARATPIQGPIGQTRFMASVWAQLLVRSQKRTDELVCGLQARGFSRRFYFLPGSKTRLLLWVLPGLLFFAFLVLATREQVWQ